jgi:hypothetical protein
MLHRFERARLRGVPRKPVFGLLGCLEPRRNGPLFSISRVGFSPRGICSCVDTETFSAACLAAPNRYLIRRSFKCLRENLRLGPGSGVNDSRRRVAAVLRGPQETPLLRFLGCKLAQRFSAGRAKERLSSPVGATQWFSRTLFKARGYHPQRLKPGS